MNIEYMIREISSRYIREKAFEPEVNLYYNESVIYVEDILKMIDEMAELIIKQRNNDPTI